MSFTTPSTNNIKWKSVAKAGVFAFASGFLSFFYATGGFTVDMGMSGAISLLGGATVSGVNILLFTMYQSMTPKEA